MDTTGSPLIAFKITLNVPVTIALRPLPLLSIHVVIAPALGVTPVPFGSAASYHICNPLMTDNGNGVIVGVLSVTPIGTGTFVAV